jgi:hypothetical protein
MLTENISWWNQSSNLSLEIILKYVLRPLEVIEVNFPGKPIPEFPMILSVGGKKFR